MRHQLRLLVLRQGKWDFYRSSHIFHVNGAGKLSQIFRTTDSYSK